MNWPRSRLVAVVYFLLAAPVTLVVLSALPQHAAPQPPASEIVLGIDPAQSKVHGLFVLRGSEHELTVPVQAEIAADHWTGRAKFSVPFIDWGLKNPGNFFLRVNHAVEIELELKGSLQGAAAL